jgi:hypothetical protein
VIDLDAASSLVVDVEVLQPAALADDESPELERAAAVRAPSNPCPAQSSCCETYYDRKVTGWATVAAAGTNTRYADYKASFADGITSSLGWAIKVGSGPFSAGGGTTTIREAEFDQRWPWSNRYGLDSFKLEVEYNHYNTWCWVWGGYGSGYSVDLRQQRRLASGYTGGEDRVQWMPANSFFPGHCVYRGSVSVAWLSSTSQRTISNGVELVGIRLSAKTNFSERGATGWRFNQPDKYWCGEYGKPALGNAGRVMADWRDR